MDDFKKVIESNITNFQKNLQCIRTLLDITMVEAGELLGVSRQSIMLLEAQQTDMTILQYVSLKSAFYRIYKHTFRAEEKNTTNSILNTSLMGLTAATMGIAPAVLASASRLQKKIFKQENSKLLTDLKATYGGKDAEEILENALSLRDINDFYDACHKKALEQRSKISKISKEYEKEYEAERAKLLAELSKKETELKQKNEAERARQKEVDAERAKLLAELSKKEAELLADLRKSKEELLAQQKKFDAELSKKEAELKQKYDELERHFKALMQSNASKLKF